MVAAWNGFRRGRTPLSWAHTDFLARHADGLLVPSVMRDGGENLVLWRWNESGVRVTFHDPKRDLGPNRA